MSRKSILYTGGNLQEIKQLCGDKLMAPYYCMGFSILTLLTESGTLTIDEGDTVVLEENGCIHVEKRTMV